MSKIKTKSQIMKELHKKWKETDPEGYKAHQSNAGKRGHILHPNMASENGKKVHKLHPNMAREIGKKRHKKLKENPEEYIKYQSDAGKKSQLKSKRDPKKYFKRQSDAGKKGNKRIRELYPELRRKWNQKGGKRLHELYPHMMKEWSRKGYCALNKNKPHVWYNVHFDSNKEMEVAKKILLKPIKGINCQIVVGTKIVDFFPQTMDMMFQGNFVEYHPFTYHGKDRNGRTREQYTSEREEAISNSEYAGIPLVVMD